MKITPIGAENSYLLSDKEVPMKTAMNKMTIRHGIIRLLLLLSLMSLSIAIYTSLYSSF